MFKGKKVNKMNDNISFVSLEVNGYICMKLGLLYFLFIIHYIKIDNNIYY